ncbi:heparan-alpha-glucosaminide N-acetyltransferase domain-containing protein, partial [Paenibacillus sp. 11B]|uniref:heparan-alpha-glucosaminide N-acetyltransferase domain-containing protein n=1 Tax=Paenibacillus sp. 11B TaxID=3060965 RepID=UPI002655232D
MQVKVPYGRIIGLDLARAMAIIGMMIVNYKLAMEAQNGEPQWLRFATELFEGRASALFVILAGVGVSLMAARARASGEVKQLKAIRSTLFRRAAFLFLAGIGLLVMGWSADILHYYALFIALSALLLRLSDKTIFTWMILILITTEIQLIYLDYSYGWSENYHEYVGLWTWSGFVRNLLFNGFHPFFPWFGFFLLGLWIGRKDW